MRLLLAAAFMILAQQAGASVWPVNQAWSTANEHKYSTWVEQNWTQDIFKKGILNGLETDCADATYAMRALYSYENGLPFRVSSKNGEVWGEDTREFDSVSDSRERFRRFLKKMFDLTNTSTLGQDTYPVSLSRESLRAGTVYVEPNEHSYQIVGLTPEGVPVLLNSTTPKMGRVLFRTLSFPFYRPESKSFSDGYRAFRWPEELGVPVRTIKRANFGQYAVTGNVLEFAEKARRVLQLRDETLAQRIDRELTNVCYFARERAFLVVKAHLKRTDQPGQCLRGSVLEDHSTVIRDRRLTEYFQSLRSLRSDPRWETLDSSHRKTLLAIFIPGLVQGQASV
ncbi:MAG: hypothetical protein EOP06_02115, partial [Proteobacteria bacterium]